LAPDDVGRDIALLEVGMDAVGGIKGGTGEPKVGMDTVAGAETDETNVGFDNAAKAAAEGPSRILAIMLSKSTPDLGRIRSAPIPPMPARPVPC
jgi:hypothetical protein